MSADRKVLAFIKENPGSTPREIADALGIPYNAVRAALMRLREAGYLVRSSRGGYIVRSGLPSGLEDELSSTQVSMGVPSVSAINHLISEIKELEGYVNDLRERVEKLEKEITIIKRGLPIRASEGSPKRGVDKLLKALREKKVIRASEALKLTSSPLETYVRRGEAVVLGDLMVLKEYFDSFKKRFPLKISEVRSLTWAEKELLEAMIKEGAIYLYGGREYRLVGGSIN